MGGRGASSGITGSIRAGNQAKLSAAGNTNSFFNQVRGMRITAATANSARFDGYGNDWRDNGTGGISSSNMEKTYIITKNSSTGEYSLTERSGRGGRNVVAIDSSKNLDSLIKKANKRLK